MFSLFVVFFLSLLLWDFVYLSNETSVYKANLVGFFCEGMGVGLTREKEWKPVVSLRVEHAHV